MGKCISILGSTGSIGTQALEVAKAHDMRIHALAANRNIDLLERQTRELRPKKVCIYDETKYHELKGRLSDLAVQVLCGMDGLCEIAADTAADMLLNSVVGMVGLLPTLTAISAGLDIALANKETLVAGGSLVMDQAAKKGVSIYPVDSEHSAIFQCLQGNRREQLRKIILTASGGPFFGKIRAELEHVTVADALNHPNWSMGSKITVDSSTLMNKGLEFIEAKWLFDLTPEQIEVVVHRQSVVHSAVEYQDYSIIAQMGVPDMKIPIQYALLYPDRMPCPTRPLSLTEYGTLTFEKPDLKTFTCLQTAITAITRGGTTPCVVNGANEEAVAAFLKGKIGFLEIGALAQRAVDSIPQTEITCYEDVMRADARAREFVHNSISQ
ncbi:1-deoxy-D-xylulose-5-phosphate reductoisomerase [Ruminococcus sp.]|uniref:1-deoxy-D-xylulose-5-phosphate reductoisomerase n=1 Tax=Ruminococcus sp. TaxID=41978 RepID=UPI0025E75105|nr:1-deoxy-D-xylulose-5-phosphate reductoisomerase [Ruminococcus sp.]